jgi:predicted DCC family thiol-disulfide oxidoreductase YuxK
MKIYYDAKCKICEKFKNLILNLQSKNSKNKNNLVFIDINNSIFDSEKLLTIVVTKEEKEFRLGAACKEIFKELKFPFSLMQYFPEFLLTTVYFFFRKIRKYI